MIPMHTTLLRAACITVTTLALLACGWHPRGSGEATLPMRQLRIESVQADDALSAQMRRLLEASGVDVVADAGHSPLLHLGTEYLTTRKVSLDRRARAAEQEMRVTIDFEVRSADGETVFGPRTVTSSRIYAFDPNSIIALQGEEQLIHRELRDDVAAQILRQLRYVPSAATGP